MAVRSQNAGRRGVCLPAALRWCPGSSLRSGITVGFYPWRRRRVGAAAGTIAETIAGPLLPLPSLSYAVSVRGHLAEVNVSLLAAFTDDLRVLVRMMGQRRLSQQPGSPKPNAERALTGLRAR